jgi:hypothetical protein
MGACLKKASLESGNRKHLLLVAAFYFYAKISLHEKKYH